MLVERVGNGGVQLRGDLDGECRDDLFRGRLHGSGDGAVFWDGDDYGDLDAEHDEVSLDYDCYHDLSEHHFGFGELLAHQPECWGDVYLLVERVGHGVV